MPWPFSYRGGYSPAKTLFYLWSRRAVAAGIAAAVVWKVLG